MSHSTAEAGYSTAVAGGDTRYTFDEEVLRMLSLSLRHRYVGKTMTIKEIYILHGNGPPTLVMKAMTEDGTEFRTDTPFFRP